MEKQYIALTDPAQIINTLCARLRDTEAQLEYQIAANQTLIVENAALRSDADRLQKAINENAKTYASGGSGA